MSEQRGQRMTGESHTESILESPRRQPGRTRGLIAAAVVVVLAVVAGVVVWQTRDDAASTPESASVPQQQKASELYAADGRTLIARFDTDDPRESCLRVPVNDWGTTATPSSRGGRRRRPSATTRRSGAIGCGTAGTR
ncbi:hypothetical protein ACQP00_18620 [Dactylosporangium sp. CS-047395]|uniref:hypothetical protein n=1 Tax=Dactylosporangium sp. CS-047395 TaxID=3239936 RepID=UPI003D9175D9